MYLQNTYIITNKLQNRTEENDFRLKRIIQLRVHCKRNVHRWIRLGHTSSSIYTIRTARFSPGAQQDYISHVQPLWDHISTEPKLSRFFMYAMWSLPIRTFKCCGVPLLHILICTFNLNVLYLFLDLCMYCANKYDFRSGHVRFVARKVALRWLFSDYFCFPCQFLLHHCFTFINHPMVRRCIVSILTASLNKQLRRKKCTRDSLSVCHRQNEHSIQLVVQMACFSYKMWSLTTKLKLNSVVLVRKRTIPTERPQPVGEVSANI
jgi:hypothetical protein